MAIDPADFAFVFVYHGGELEIKALLLAASLRATLGRAPELIAAVPQPSEVWGAPSAAGLALLDALTVRVLTVDNPIDATYPIGNKLACLGVATRARTVVVLDSDILCLRPFDHDPAAVTGFAAKPADKRTFPGGLEVWQPLYAAVGTRPYPDQVTTTFSGESGPPYFNSGVIFTRRPSELGAAWIACARRIDPRLQDIGQRHWLDQVALPLAVRCCGMGFTVLDERWNHPAHLRRLDDALPYFCHYHWPSVIAREPRLRDRVRALAAAHATLRAALAAHPAWTELVAPG
jgi:hypothetical protein